MELKKRFIGCMSTYKYSDSIYFNNMTDLPNGYHNRLILNQMPDFLYITSPSKLMDDIS